MVQRHRQDINASFRIAGASYSDVGVSAEIVRTSVFVRASRCVNADENDVEFVVGNKTIDLSFGLFGAAWRRIRLVEDLCYFLRFDAHCVARCNVLVNRVPRRKERAFTHDRVIYLAIGYVTKSGSERMQDRQQEENGSTAHIAKDQRKRAKRKQRKKQTAAWTK